MKIKYVKPETLSDIRVTERILIIRGLPVPEELVRERKAGEAHEAAIFKFADRISLGSALKSHPVDVLNWLIEQGWTPPAGKYLLEEEN